VAQRHLSQRDGVSDDGSHRFNRVADACTSEVTVFARDRVEPMARTERPDGFVCRSSGKSSEGAPLEGCTLFDVSLRSFAVVHGQRQGHDRGGAGSRVESGSNPRIDLGKSEIAHSGQGPDHEFQAPGRVDYP
jgi:hypothetical protein